MIIIEYIKEILAEPATFQRSITPRALTSTNVHNIRTLHNITLIVALITS